MVCRVTPCVAAMVDSDCVPVAQLMKQAMVAAFLLCVWVLRVKQWPHWVHRQRVVPLLVVPFFFVGWLHSGYRGRLVVIPHIQPAECLAQVRWEVWDGAVNSLWGAINQWFRGYVLGLW